MPKKTDRMSNKLGSWTDQAQLTRHQAPPEVAPTPADTAPSASYPVALSLLERIALTAAHHGLTQNELVGHLLTWALDQVEAGAHQLPKPRPDSAVT